MILSGLGVLGADPEIRYVGQDSKPVMDLRLAFRTSRKDRDGKYLTTWISASMWGKRAESIVEYLHTGSKVSVHLKDVCIEEFEDRNGNQRSKMVAEVVDIELAGDRSGSEGGGRGEGRGDGRSDGGRESRGGGRGAPDGGRGAPQGRRPPPKSAGGFEGMEDDIPF